MRKIEYICPMHPEQKSSRPGDCSICGMPLEMKGKSEEGFDRIFWLSIALFIPLFIFGMLHLFPWLQAVLSAPIVLFAGWPLYVRGVKGLNMFTLIGMGALIAFFYSLYGLRAGGEVYFEVAGGIVSLVLLGQMLEGKARRRTAAAIEALIRLAPPKAHRIEGEEEREVAVEEVKIGDLLRVRPGERVPVDGRVTEGISEVDESLMTGEPFWVQKQSEDFVTGGTLNRTGSFIFRAERIGEEMMLSRIIERVEEASRSRAPIQKLADRVSAFFVPTVLFISFITFWAWGGREGILHAVAVLVIACPCALGLATPMSILVGVGRGALEGLLIRDAIALESMAKVNVLVVDKTGTLTVGRPTLETIHAEDEVMRWAAAVEAQSEHPLARSFAEEAKKRNISLPKVEWFRAIPGEGVEGEIEGHIIWVGKAVQGGVEIRIDGVKRGECFFSDPIKETTPEAIQQLHREKIELVMATGDRREVAEKLGKDLGIDQIFAGVKPEQKEAIVEKLQREGKFVAVAGDGINDAPALARAQVGIAMGTGSEVAIETASLTLVRGDLRSIAKARALSRATLRNIRQNLVLSFLYNVLGIPFAAFVTLNPLIASGAMVLSSLSVIANALRLQSVPLALELRELGSRQ